jgi:hypothetical protein
MRTRWKLLGLAGVAGVAATGAVVAHQKREQVEYTPDELRDKLHARMSANDDGPAAQDGESASASA